MRYLVQVFNESRAFARTATKADAQKAYERLCQEHPDALVVFSDRKGVIAERPAKVSDNRTGGK